ncbi:MAG: PAS domain-containing protein [Rhodospirillales bacterium]
METNNDITERQRAEERLRAAEQELRRVVDTIPGMVWSSSPERGFVSYVNARWADMGLSLDDVEGSKWQSIVHPDDLPKLEEDWARSRLGGQPCENVSRLRQANGEYRWMLARAAPLRDDAGKILRWYGIAHDTHHGQISARTNDGAGATFSVRLPAGNEERT